MVLLSIGNSSNVPKEEFLLDSEEELKDIPECSPGSTAIILTNGGMVVKMKNSKGEWIDI